MTLTEDCQRTYEIFAEVVAPRCFVKKVFLKI